MYNVRIPDCSSSISELTRPSSDARPMRIQVDRLAGNAEQVAGGMQQAHLVLGCFRHFLGCPLPGLQFPVLWLRTKVWPHALRLAQCNLSCVRPLHFTSIMCSISICVQVQVAHCQFVASVPRTPGQFHECVARLFHARHASNHTEPATTFNRILCCGVASSRCLPCIS